jgi:ribonucleoside-diphosphate reductase alpha chain
MEYSKISDDIWGNKYQLKDNANNPVDYDRIDNYLRVAIALSNVEKENKEAWRAKFVEVMKNGCIPAGRIMANAGADTWKPNTTLINCTVSPMIKDSIESIMGVLSTAAISLKSGAGIGYEFSNIRPNGSYIKGAGAYTSGLLPFMDIYDTACASISSSGGRRGAQMATLDIRHPEIIEYTHAKRKAGRFRQFNLSILVTDEFMEKVKNDEEHLLIFPLHKSDRQDVETVWDYWPSGKHDSNYTLNQDGQVKCKVYSRIKARELWDIIMKSTYEFSDPGIILIDRMNLMNPLSFLEEIRATNPCK